MIRVEVKHKSRTTITQASIQKEMAVSTSTISAEDREGSNKDESRLQVLGLLFRVTCVCGGEELRVCTPSWTHARGAKDTHVNKVSVFAGPF